MPAYKKTIHFYLLKKGEYFNYQGKKYKKVSDDGAIKKGNKRITNFWPQVTVKLYLKMEQNEFFEKYPLAECYQSRNLEKDYSFS